MKERSGSSSRSAAVLALALSVLSAGFGCATGGGGSKPPAAATETGDGAELAAVIDAVKQALGEAESRRVAGLPELKTVTLTLETTVSQSASGQVRYLVATVGAGVSDETVSKLELELAPLRIVRKSLLPGESLKDALAQAIHLAEVGVAEAAKGEPPLAMKSVVIDIRFTVAVQGSASAGVTVKLFPVGVSGTAAISRSRIHRVRLAFSS